MRRNPHRTIIEAGGASSAATEEAPARAGSGYHPRSPAATVTDGPQVILHARRPRCLGSSLWRRLAGALCSHQPLSIRLDSSDVVDDVPGTELATRVEPAAAPVFVDTTGRRRRHAHQLAGVLAAVCSIYLAMFGAGLAGRPVHPSAPDGAFTARPSATTSAAAASSAAAPLTVPPLIRPVRPTTSRLRSTTARPTTTTRRAAPPPAVTVPVPTPRAAVSSSQATTEPDSTQPSTPSPTPSPTTTPTPTPTDTDEPDTDEQSDTRTEPSASTPDADASESSSG